MIKDYDAVLESYDDKKAEPGQVELVAVEDLKIEMFWIEGSISGDSYYEIPAINLILECEDYEPDGILCYLPDISKYGTWDCDHWELKVFEDATWKDIKSNPLPYLNAQWEDTVVKTCNYDVSSYTMIEGRPF